MGIWDLLVAAATGLGAIGLAAMSLGGLPMTSDQRYHRRALVIGRLTCIAFCIYPLQWAWRTPYSGVMVAVLCGLYGAVFGLAYWALGLWYGAEVNRPHEETAETGKTIDDRETKD